MSTSSYRNPSLEEAASIFKEALSKRYFTFVLGDCKVEYNGRASSTLNWGNRLIIFKADGSILVHRPIGYEPVNWQPTGCIFQVEVDTGQKMLKVKAGRLRSNEVLTIFLRNMYEITVTSLKDNGEFALHITELDMKKAILSNPALVEMGFRPFASEKELKECGFIDIYGEDSEGNIIIVEIKRTAAGKDAILQLERYVKAVQKKVNRKVRGVIIAPNLRLDAQLLLASVKLEFKRISLRKCYEILKFEKIRKLTDYTN